MDNHKSDTVIVRYPAKTTIVLLIILFFLELAVVFLAVSQQHRAVCIVLGIAIAIFCIYIAIASTLFCIQVNGTVFEVRTKTGKKFSFACNEINKISCKKIDSVKNGPSFYIYVFANDNTLTVEGRMAGFRELASYLLTQLSTGEIPDTAASSSCKTELRRYANGEIYTKE